MCGIFGYSIKKNNVSFKEFEKNTKFLFVISELRGQDSSGISILCDQEILTHKEVIKPSLMIKRQGFNKVLANGFTNSSKILSLIGHCRLTTNGSFFDNNNNHPIETSNFVGVHNGIVLNAESFSNLNTQNITTREHFYAPNDTKSFFTKIDELTNRFKDIKYAISQVFDLIDGSASIALLDKKTRNILLATNTGSLHYILEEGTGNFVYASEHQFLIDFVNKSPFFKNSCPIIQLKPGQCLEVGEVGHILVDLNGFEVRSDQTREQETLPNLFIQSDVSQLKRCTRCILPRTYPFIEFDENALNRRSQFFLPAIKILKRAGITLVLDNFGSGLASLSYLYSYPFDYVKVDHYFVKTLPRSERNLKLIQSVLSISGQLKFKLIAEGIDTQEQYQALLDAGCEFGQGKYLQKAEKQKNLS